MSCMSSIISLMKCQMSFWTQNSQNFKMALVKEYLWGALENIFSWESEGILNTGN